MITQPIRVRMFECLSFCMHARTQELLDGLSQNMIEKNLQKDCIATSIFIYINYNGCSAIRSMHLYLFPEHN
jgi:hypothetical protein